MQACKTAVAFFFCLSGPVMARRSASKRHIANFRVAAFSICATDMVQRWRRMNFWIAV